MLPVVLLHRYDPFLLSYRRIWLVSSIGYWLDIEWPALVNRFFGSKRRKIWLLVVVSENRKSVREY